MIPRLFVLFMTFCMTLSFSDAARAQSVAWVQIEAAPTLAVAQTRVRDYAARLPDVAGFQLRSGLYGIVLGPYAPDDAVQRLRDLRGQSAIPSDSYIEDGSRFRQQFWPIGASLVATPEPIPLATAAQDPSVTPVEPATAPEPVAAPAPEPVIQLPDETRAEALESESELSRPERELLQTALKWAGFYDAAIDGAYGRGTRSSMAAWQTANNHEPTGVLTTAQRAELLAAYNAVLNGLDLQLVRDDATGIEMQMPTAVVAFDRYEPPFARFAPKGDLQAQVLLISQEGDADRLAGLYQILQTLAMVPTEGPRTLKDRSFEIEGTDAVAHTYIQARLDDGVIKGFALIWPAGDEERRTRLLETMKASFATVDGSLDPGLVQPGEDQAIDLLAGLEIRKPKLSRSGFYIDGQGSVLTTTEAVASCDYVTLDGATEAEVGFTDPALGIAVLTPKTPLAPLAVAAFQTAVPRLQSEVAVGGYPYGAVLVAPSVTFGKLADLRGLNGEETIKRLALTAQPGDAGGPVFDNGGAVLGMLAPKVSKDGQVLPAEVSFSVDADAILTALAGAGVSVETTDSVAYMTPELIAQKAAQTTVLVSCW